MTQGLKHPGIVTIGLEARCLVTLRQVTIVGPATFGLMTSGLVTLSQETLGRLTIGLKPLGLVTLSLETIGASYTFSCVLRHWDLPASSTLLQASQAAFARPRRRTSSSHRKDAGSAIHGSQ